jgi:hypothetical protein
MTRERLTKPVAPLQRAPEVAPQARVPAPPVKPARLPRTLEAKPVTPARLEIQRARAFEVQRLADLEVQRAAIQRAHDDRFTQAHVAQTAWHARGTKTIGVQRAVSEHARTARNAQHTRAAFVAQRSSEHLESLVAQRLEAEVCPALPAVQRQADLTLSHVADHFGSKAAVQLARDPDRLSSYAGFKNAGAGLVKNFRTPGSSHAIPELAKAIQRFREPMQRAAVEGAVYAAFGSHPTYPKQLQRALEERDANLEVQREAWQRELVPVAQRQALEEAGGEGAALQIESARGSGQPLPVGVRAMLEAKWNTDLSKVRVHTDSRSSQISKKLNAKALTAGQDIFFGASTFNPTSLDGLQLIAHEAWHTVQQAGGLVQAGIDRSASLEVEASGKGAELSSGDVQIASSSAATRATRVTNLTKDNTLRGLTGHAPLSLKAVQRAPSSAVAAQSAKATAKGTPINRTGGVIDSGGVNLRDQPNAQGRIVTHLKAGATLTVQAELDGGWYKVTSSAGSGYAASHLVKLAPDKGAVLHQISAGQPAIAIAEKYYKGAVKPGQDLRFYVNVLHHVNPDAIPNPSGDDWTAAVTLKNYWIWIPSVTFAQTLNGQVKNGSFTGGGYDAIKKNAAAMVKATIGQLPGGKEVLQTLADIGSSGERVLSNPGAFITNFGKAVGQGFGQFSANLPKHLEDSVVSLFTGTMGGIALPKTWDATGIIHVGLQMVGGTPEQLEARLVSAVPGGMAAINAAGEAKNALTGIQKDGFAPTAMKYYAEGAALKETILGGVKSYVLNTVVKQGIVALGSLFIPGAGIIQVAIKLYETIRFIWDKFQDLANTAKAITASLAAIASGNIADAVVKISSSLVGVLGLGVNFLARIAKLDGIVTRVKALFDKIKAPIKAAIDKVIAWFKGLVSGKRGAKPSTSSKPQAGATTAKPATSGLQIDLKEPITPKDQPAHTLVLKGEISTAQLAVHSNPKTFTAWVASVKANLSPAPNSPLSVQVTRAEKTAALIYVAKRASKALGDTNYSRMVKLMNTLGDTMERILELSAMKPPASVVKYGPLNGGQQATLMHARVLSSNFVEGTVPREDSAVMKTIKGNRNEGRGIRYIEGHLLNHNLGGKGELYNQTVLSRTANKAHLNEVETEVKRLIAAGKVLEYIVEPDYGSALPMTANQQALQAQLAGLAANDPKRVNLTRQFNAMDYERANLAYRLNARWHELSFDNTDVQWKKSGATQRRNIDNTLDGRVPA